jgi:iron complex outermembrane receptor protein
MHRDYKSTGEEALAPPVTQNAWALFGMEQISFERVRLQFGGRLEQNRYNPEDLASRTFTGASASAGIHIPLWTDGAFVANYTRSYRAPAIEELYNNGPHIGNLVFEVGNPDLLRERGDGVELSLRHQSRSVRAEVNSFYYKFDDYVFLALTGEVEDGLNQAQYNQARARYMGAEAKLDTRLHPNLWLNLSVDAVDAQLTDTKTPLPRIPPVRGRIGFDFRKAGFSLRPELVLSNAQFQLYPTETRTAGYGVFNLMGSYTIARQHMMHVFSATLFNATDQLYRNHLSFIKDYAPEIGRGIRVSYTMNFY